jgi:spore coat protein U-like protein
MRNTIALLTLLLAGELNSLTAGNFSLQIGNVTWIGSAGGYNCFSSTAYPNTVDFNIVKVVNGTTSYAFAAGPSAQTGSYSRQLVSGVNTLNYQLYTSSTMTDVLEAPLTANANQVISGSSSASGGTIIPLSFTFFIPPNQRVAPGTYTDQITISIFNSYNDAGAPQDTRTITFTAVVAPIVNICLVPAGAGFSSTSSSQTLDYGMLSQGQVRGCDLLALQNTGCSIAFTSANHGVLSTTPPSTSAQVPYAFTVNGNALDLAQTANFSLPPTVSVTQDGTRLPISVTIGAIGNAPAGAYSDNVTITVTVQ